MSSDKATKGDSDHMAAAGSVDVLAPPPAELGHASSLSQPIDLRFIYDTAPMGLASADPPGMLAQRAAQDEPIDRRVRNLRGAVSASSRNLTSLRSLDLRGHRCWSLLDRAGEDWGGIGALSRSPLLAQTRLMS